MAIPVRNRASMAAKRSQVNWRWGLTATDRKSVARACGSKEQPLLEAGTD